MLLILVPTVWLAIAILVVCLCRMAAISDAQPQGNGPAGTLRAQVLVLEPVSLAQRAGLARVRSRAALPSSGLATVHPLR